uniref:succinate dehydrogenase subunit 4 n=2 Tax=Pedicularis TaxID=43174 RepID=UPI0024112CB2|nr:succinate dehydrogenase subunit 4 [Pedicularis chinensis]WEI33122.1 succinate dehydrogenase subunit 4 [Pedicularis chinensis]
MVLAFCRRGLVIPICLYLLVGRYMKERISGLRNESSKTKRTGLFQRITAAFPLPLIIIYKKVSSTFLPNLSLFWHINEGIEEIMADHVHQEMTRNLILVYLRLFLLIVIKDVFLSLVSFLNKSKNLMDRTQPFEKTEQQESRKRSLEEALGMRPFITPIGNHRLGKGSFSTSLKERLI